MNSHVRYQVPNLSWQSMDPSYNPYNGQETLPNLVDYSNIASTSSQSSKKPKTITFQASKITIGYWNIEKVYPNDITVKFYMAREKLILEFLNHPPCGSTNTTIKTKIEISWQDILSIQAIFNCSDEFDLLELELKKPPIFFVEVNQRAGRPIQWQQTDQDFTGNHASYYRRHQIYVKPGILKPNLDKLVSARKFWFELLQVKFPLHECPSFDGDYNNSLSQTLSINNVDNANQDLAGDGEDILIEYECRNCAMDVCILHHPMI